MTYDEFLKSKKITVAQSGFEKPRDDMNDMLFDWQKDIVFWALKKGRAALFEDCGLGKTVQQLEWAQSVSDHTGMQVLIVAPLAVAEQTKREGYIGIRDFRGDVIRWMQELGFIYHSEVCIWKNPVTAMQRTKALGLLHKQIKKNSCMSRQGIPDYVVTFRKPGENPEPVSHTDETYPVSHWQHVASPIWEEYSSPTWWDINQSDTLNRKAAREEKDERHICPLQLPVIERCVELWSNPGDVVLDPFDGIGSTGYQAIKMGRKHIGVELKKSYFDLAVENCKQAELEVGQSDEIKLF